MLSARFSRLVIAVALLAATPCARAESYLPLDKIKILFPVSDTVTRILVIELVLAVANDEQLATLRGKRADLKKAIETDLAAKGVDAYTTGNLAETIKKVAHVAAQRTAGELRIRDALIRSAQLR